MPRHLTDAVFAFAVRDGNDFLAARDVLGIKTLFYGWRDGTLYLASELKGLLEVTDDVREFPAGHVMDREGRLTRFADLPVEAPETRKAGVEEMAADIREIIQRSFDARVDFSVPTACLLSGGMDSSVISLLAAESADEPLHTFVVGLGESGDIRSARIMADHLGTEHHELRVGLDEVLEVLPEVIYHLESFDPSLVRSSVSNFLVSREAARHGIEVLLSGEGGDEVFCGYTYLKRYPADQLFARQMECIRYLHNNASLRLDRMNMCNSVRVVAPLISGELLAYALTVPPQHKQRPTADGEKVEKWIFREAYRDRLPEAITGRLKQEFSQGSGSAAVLPAHFDREISDAELGEARKRHPVVRSKEELHYFRIFTKHFGDDPAVVGTVGQWPHM